ncbi:MAG: hypothetical protein NTX22_11195 [Ignavibacteriales bacterium]|nr:hypothetical protein [Ignavibacteriales bacterium]
MDLEHRTFTWKDELLNWLPSIIMFPIMIYWIANRGHYGFIDNADLIIHEGGHLIFIFFGKFIYTAGGTLMQIILPSIIAFYFFRSMYKTGVQVALLWLGQNFINISVYSADARAHQLPLLGGSKVYHDWTYLLSTLGILDYDIEVGYFFFGIAILIFIVALILPKFMYQDSIVE